MKPLVYLAARLGGGLVMVAYLARMGIFVFALALLQATSADAQIVWIGNTSTNWGARSNWSTNSVPTSSGNVVINTGTGNQPIISTANATSNFLTVGLDANSTANTSLTIQTGFKLATSGNGNIGSGVGSNGAVLVSGLNSLWSVAGNFSVGFSGTGNLTVANAALANITGNDANGIGAYVGFGANSSGTVNVTDAVQSSFIGTSSSLNVSGGELALGYNGAGNLTVANGGQVNASGKDAQGIGAAIGYGANSTGAATVTGGTYVYSGSPWFTSAFNVSNGALAVGYNGAGTLTVANIALANITGNDANGISAYIGYGANSTGAVTVKDELNIPTNFGSTLRSFLTVGGGALAVGYGGTGNLTMANGGHARISGSDANGIGAYVGYGSNSAGNITVTDIGPLSGDGSGLYVDATMAVGYNGHGHLLVANGGNVNVAGSDANGISTYVGYGANSTGTVTVIGFWTDPYGSPTSSLNVSHGALAVGYNGNASLTVANGGSLTANGSDSHGVSAYIGYGANSTSSVTVQDLLLDSNGQGFYPYSSQLNVSNGILVVGYQGNATLTIANGGMVYAANGMLLASQAGSHATLAINSGGVLEIGGQNGLAVGNGTASISMDGGIIRAPPPPIIFSSGPFGGFGGGGVIIIFGNPGPPPPSTPANNDITLTPNLTLNNSNALPNIIDTNGSNVTLLGILSGNGSLEKISNGTLTLSANETYTGDTIVNGGTLTESANGSIASTSNLTVDGTTATFDLGGNHSGTFASVTLTNGGSITGTGNSTLTSSSNFQLMNGTVTAALGGNNISLIKTSSGLVTLAGNNTYTGGTVINGGLINFNSGNNFGTANLTLNGGGLQWAANNTLDISNRLNPLNSGNDTFDTNGNNVTFSSVITGNGTLVKTGNGTLTLALNNTYTGGTVVTGGLINFNSLNNFGTGNFTLSGGGLQWAANNTLDVSSYVSPLGAGNDTFDTNGHDITFAANITGSGALVKAGLGNLTLASGNNSYTGGTVVTGGQLIIHGGTVGQSSSDFTVGDQGNATASLTINNGSNITGGSLVIGAWDFTNGSVLVTGANTTLNFSHDIYSGNYGVGNLSVLNGSKITAGGTLLVGFQGGGGIYDPASNTTSYWVNSGTVLVSGANSSIIVAGGISMGQGGSGNLTVANGGYVATTGYGFLDGQGGTAITLVTDPNSKLSVNGLIQVGYVGSGSGNLTVANGGNVTAASVAVGTGINGTLLVTGANSTLQTTGHLALGGTFYGGGGHGNLTVANGGSVTSGADLFIGGGLNNDTGTVLVTGANSTLRVANDTFVGSAGEGCLTVANGGNLNINGLLIVASESVGTTSTTNGTVLVADTHSTLQVASDILIGGIGYGHTGIGSLTVANGGYLSSNGSLQLALSTASTGIVLVTGATSTLDIANGAVIGEYGTGTLTIANGGSVNLLSGSNLTLGQNSVPDGLFAVQRSTGTVNLNSGGTLQVGGVDGIQVGSGNYAFNFGGGTVQVGRSDFTTAINATLVNSTTSIINTNGLNATWSGNLSGGGGLSKSGNGTLTLAGNNTYTGNTLLGGGTLNFTNGFTSSPSATFSGQGNIGGSIRINGTLLPGAPGSAGQLSFGQNLTLGTNATTLFQLGGTTPGTQYSAVSVSGNLMLGGTFLLSLINNFSPGLSDTFSLLAFVNALSGAFTNFLLPDSGVGLDWNVSLLNTTGNLSVAAPTSYSSWLVDSGLSGNRALPAAKPFSGPANLVRYAMNLETAPTASNLPSTNVAVVSGTTFLRIQYRVRKNMADCQLVPQFSTDMVNWTNVSVGNITQLADADTYTAQYQARVAMPLHGSVFLRVVAQMVP